MVIQMLKINKTVLIGGTLIIILVIVIVFSAWTILLGGFIRLEQENTRRNIERMQEVYNSAAENLTIKAFDWSRWDDTYHFIQNGNQEYIDSNLNLLVFADLKLNLMMFINRKGQYVFAKAFDLTTNKEIPVPEGLKKHFMPDSVLLRHEKADIMTGFINYGKNTVLVTAQPILKNDGMGPAAGTLVFGRFIDQELIDNFGKLANLPIRFRQYSQIPPRELAQLKLDKKKIRRFSP